MAGIGKTSLASAVAMQCIDRFPDGQIVINMKGVDETPRDPVDAIASVLNLVAPHLEPKHKDLDSIRADYLSALHGKRILLLLDNAKSAEQVEKLIPPRGSLLVVTSRTRFHLAGAAPPVELNLLTESAAVDFLTSLVPKSASVARDIARLCGGLPLALRLATAAMLARPDLRPAAYAKQLADERRRHTVLASVLDSIGLSHRLLDGRAQGALIDLAVFPDDFDAAAAAAAWGLDELDADEVVDQLVRFALLRWNPHTERYFLHDLVREFAGSQLDAARMAEARKRHAVHFERVLAEAERLYLAHGDAQRQGIALLLRERLNVDAGIRWAVDHAANDADADALCCTYPETGLRVMTATGMATAELWRACLAAARRRGQRRVEGIALRRLSTFAGVEEKGPSCLAALAIAREVGDRTGEASALQNLADYHADRHEPDEAKGCAQEALDIAQDLGDLRLEAFAIRALGSAYGSLGQPYRELECYQRRRDIARRLGDLHSEAVVLDFLAKVHQRGREAGAAVECHLDASDILHGLGLHREELVHLEKACTFLRTLGRGHDMLALSVRMRGIANPDQAGDQLICASQEAFAYLTLGRPADAAAAFEAAVDAAESVGLGEHFILSALACRNEAEDVAGVGAALDRLEGLRATNGKCKPAGGAVIPVILGEHALGRGLRVAERLEAAFVSMPDGLAAADLDLLANAIDVAGRALAALPDVRRGIRLYERALALASDLGAGGLRSSIPNSLAIRYVEVGDFERAAAIFADERDAAVRTGEAPEELNARSNLAFAVLRAGRSDDARRMMRELTTRLRELTAERSTSESAALRARCDYLVALNETNLGGALVDEPDGLDESTRLVEGALQTFRRMRMRDHEPECLCNLARVAIRRGEFPRAVELASAAVAIAVETNITSLEFACRWTLGEAHLANGDGTAARAAFAAVVAYERTIGHLQADEHAARLASVSPAAS
jgi:tetratricopeptide (TPR) repeat protein